MIYDLEATSRLCGDLEAMRPQLLWHLSVLITSYSNLYQRWIFQCCEHPLTQIDWHMTSWWPWGYEAAPFEVEGGQSCGIAQFWSDVTQICTKGTSLNVMNVHWPKLGDLWPRGCVVTSRPWGHTSHGFYQFWSNLTQICTKGESFNVVNIHCLRLGDLWPPSDLEAMRPLGHEAKPFVEGGGPSCA